MPPTPPDREDTPHQAQHLDVIARHFPGGMYRLDTDLRIRFATPVYERWFQRPMAQIVGQPLKTLMTPHQYELVLPRLLRVLEGETVRYLNVLEHPDGPEHRAQMVFAPEFDDGGRVCGLVSVYTDVTEVEQARERSERWEAQLRALMNALPDPIWLKDGDGVYLACNPAFARRLDLSAPQVLGRRDEELVSEHMARQFRDTDAMALRAGRALTVTQVDPLGPDGPRGVFEITKAPVRDTQGHLLGILGVARDVTLQRATERQLRDANENLQATLGALPDLVMEFDVDGTYRMVLTPQHEALAAPPPQMLGRRIPDVLPPDVAAICMQALEQAARTGHAQAPAYALKLPQGTRWFEMSVSRKPGPEGQAPTLIALARDVTGRERTEQALRRTTESLQITLDSMAQGMVLFNADGELLLHNRRLQELMGFDDAFMATRPSLRQQIAHQVARGDFTLDPDGPMARYLQSSRPHDIPATYTRRLPSGLVLQVDTRVLSDGGMVRTFSDVTDHINANDRLRIERQRLAQILEGTQAGTWDWNVLTGETEVNARWAEIIGRRLEDVVPLTRQRFIELMHPEDRLRSQKRWESYLEGQSERYECDMRLRHQDGHWVWVLSRGRAHTWSADGRPLRVSGTELDISELKLAEDRLRHIAQHDPLTELPNRSLLSDRLQRSIAMARREQCGLVLMFIDLDRFKPINDTLGHDIGDAVLRQVAQRMLDCMRESDSVARVGGDEFVVLLERVQQREDAMAVAEKLRREVSLPIGVDQHRLEVSASIGVAIYPDHGNDHAALMVSADHAMYQAKNLGGNRVRLAQLS